ncbi:hypothetical protein Tco_1175691 [Tanacetum coccineum]
MKYHPHDPYSAATQFWGVTDWYQEPRFCHVGFRGFHGQLDGEAALLAPPSPDYMPGPEEPEHAPPSPDFIPEPVYPEFMPPKDDVLPEEEESSEDYADDKEEDEDKVKEEEEEHLAPVDSVPPPACRTTARMSIRDQTPIPFLSVTEVGRFLAISTLPPSPLTSYSSPLPVSSPPLPASPTHPLGYKAAMIRLRAESPSTSHPLPLPSPIVLSHTRASMAMMRVAAPSTYILASRSKTPPSGTPPLLPIPLPTSSPPFLLPYTDYRADAPEVTLPPRKSTLDAEIRHNLDREIGYGITDTWDEMVEDMQGTPTATDVAELSQRMTHFVNTVRQDTNEIYKRLDDAQDDRSLMSGQLNLLRRDRRAHARTPTLMKSEARLSREAWVLSMDANDTTQFEVRALWTPVLAQHIEIRDLRAAYRKRQTQLIEALTLLRTL